MKPLQKEPLMKEFWKSKKWLAFAACIVISLITMVLNSKFGFNIDPNIILALVGLNAVYILMQGKIDAKNPADHYGKEFFKSHKFVATMIGNLIPVILGWANKEFGLNLSPEMIWGLIGLDGIYLLRKGALDLKDPSKH